MDDTAPAFMVLSCAVAVHDMGSVQGLPCHASSLDVLDASSIAIMGAWQGEAHLQGAILFELFLDL